MAKEKLLGDPRLALSPETAAGDLFAAVQLMAPEVINDLRAMTSDAVRQLQRIDPQTRGEALAHAIDLWFRGPPCPAHRPLLVLVGRKPRPGGAQEEQLEEAVRRCRASHGGQECAQVYWLLNALGNCPTSGCHGKSALPGSDSLAWSDYSCEGFLRLATAFLQCAQEKGKKCAVANILREGLRAHGDSYSPSDMSELPLPDDNTEKALSLLTAIWGWGAKYRLFRGIDVVRGLAWNLPRREVDPEVALYLSVLCVAVRHLIDEDGLLDDVTKQCRLSAQLAHQGERATVLLSQIPEYHGRQDETRSCLTVMHGNEVNYHLTYESRPRKWFPADETRTEVIARLVKDFRELVGEMLDAKEKWVRENLRNAPTGLGGKLDKKHLEWLIAFQVMEKSYYGIGEKDKDAVAKVTRGIETAAQLLVGPRFRDWLRAVKPGRPRTSG